MRAAGVILAAGAGSRFGGNKLQARIDGAPILAHVLAAARGAGLAPILVVLDPAGARSAPALGVRSDELVVNPEPARGLSSSLRLGLAAAGAAAPRVDAAVVLLGDQPLVRPATIRALVAALDGAAAEIAVPVYGGAGGQNPVALRRVAFALAEEADGDRGLGPLLAARPELARRVPIESANPDIDTRADLARIAELAWAERVRANRDQVDRVRESPDDADFYASVSSIFRDDPGRTGDPVLDRLRAEARLDDTWLDIGAGAGRYALPIAREVQRLIALDPSPSMLKALREAMTAHAIANITVVQGRWPEDASEVGLADVSFIAHVGYDVEAIGPFVDAMEAATRRTCLAVLMERTPATMAAPFWPPVHGEERVSLPALPAFVDVLVARGRSPKVEIAEATRRRWRSVDELIAFLRKQLWTQPDSAKDVVMLDLVERWAAVASDGSVELTVVEPLSIGVVAWAPTDGSIQAGER